MAYYGIYGPKGLPKEVVDKVNAAVKKTLEDPAVKKRIEDTGSLDRRQHARAVRRADQGRVRGLQEGREAAEADAGVTRLRAACTQLRRAIAQRTPSIDHFVDALWLEDGLSRNTLAAYRRDLALFARLAAPRSGARARRRPRETDLHAYCASRATPAARRPSANRRLTVFKRYFRWALREQLHQRRPDPAAARRASSRCACPRR